VAEDGEVGAIDAELHKKRIAADYKGLKGRVDGKRILRHLYTICGQGDTSFVRGDSHAMAFQEGRRWVWLQIEAALHWKPEEREKVLEEES